MPVFSVPGYCRLWIQELEFLTTLFQRWSRVRFNNKLKNICLQINLIYLFNIFFVIMLWKYIPSWNHVQALLGSHLETQHGHRYLHVQCWRLGLDNRQSGVRLDCTAKLLQRKKKRDGSRFIFMGLSCRSQYSMGENVAQFQNILGGWSLKDFLSIWIPLITWLLVWIMN